MQAAFPPRPQSVAGLPSADHVRAPQANGVNRAANGVNRTANGVNRTANGVTSGARLYVDVSNTLEAASLSGIQRVTLELTEALGELATVVALDGRTGRLVPLLPGQYRRLQRLRMGHGGRTIAQRIVSRAIKSSPAVGSAAVRSLAGRSAVAFDADSVLLDIESSWHAPIRRADLLARFDTPSAALIHDILPITNPEWFPPEAVSRFRSWFDAHVAAGSTLMAVSNATADAVAAAGAERPTVIRMGSSAASPISTGSGILMVGTIEPRKGHTIVLDALDLLGADAPIVDIVGRPGWNTSDLVNRLELHPKVRWHRGLDERDLETLWGLSGLLLQPSLGEGFGLPVVEALQRGVSVASSDIPVLHEIGRGQTTLLPTDAEAWANTLASFATDPGSWPQPDRLEWPTWNDSATDVLGALTTAAAWPDGKPCAK